MVTEGTIWNLELIPRGKNLPIGDADSNEFRAAAIMVSPGNSGGPLLTLDAGTYKVVGSATLIVGSATGSHIAFYTDLQDIKDFLTRVTEKYDGPQESQ
jgi:S1-C subfamily serine protease